MYFCRHSHGGRDDICVALTVRGSVSKGRCGKPSLAKVLSSISVEVIRLFGSLNVFSDSTGSVRAGDC
jgi:hypothetical protein